MTIFETETILEAKAINKIYRVDGRDIGVLNDLSFTVQAGEFVAIMGSSGSGKTTLLSLLSGLDSPSSGRVVVQGQDVTDLSEDELAPLRNRTIGFVFQSFHLIPSLSALENVMFPAELQGVNDARAKAAALLGRVGMEHRQGNFPHQLSGGEKQRVALCRRSLTSREFFLPMSRLATSIQRMVRPFWICWSICIRSTAPR